MAENPIKTPLPADLPEDWTGGQTVAPTGAEVGLSEQHGYNYLMSRSTPRRRPLKRSERHFRDWRRWGPMARCPPGSFRRWTMTRRAARRRYKKP